MKQRSQESAVQEKQRKRMQEHHSMQKQGKKLSVQTRKTRQKQQKDQSVKSGQAKDRRAEDTGRITQATVKQTWRPGNMLYPVPAVMVSVARPDEKPNVITVAWAGTINSDPAMLSISVRKERYSHAILCETKEFVVNLVNEPLVRACDYCGVRSGRDVDKFAQMKLTPVAVEGVNTPAIAESPVNLACKVTQIIPLGTHDMFLAEIVSVTVDERYMDEKGTFHLNDAGLVAYSHGTYFKLGKELGTFGYSVRKKKK